MGGDPNQPLTKMSKKDHKALHSDLNNFLDTKTTKDGNHSMRPNRGNSGDDIQQNFHRSTLLGALAEFYSNFRNKYPKAAGDFFKQHPHLDK